jgi:hypothetical protein
MSFWYKRRELAFRISLCLNGQSCDYFPFHHVLTDSFKQVLCLDGWEYVIALVSFYKIIYEISSQGLLAFGLVRAHTSLLQGWQFLYLAEVGFRIH